VSCAFAFEAISSVKRIVRCFIGFGFSCKSINFLFGNVNVNGVLVLVVFLYALLPYNNFNSFFSHDVYFGSQLIKGIYYI
jgi:hypothetical protein